MKISIIIPCFNEEKTISLVINKILSSYPGEKEIIVIDDCYNDKTREILKSDLENKIDKLLKKIKAYDHEKNCSDISFDQCDYHNILDVFNVYHLNSNNLASTL